jgi:hypothetical protein
MPGRLELAQRLEQTWVDDIYLLDEMILRAEPVKENS